MAVFHSQLNAGQATEACRVHVLIGPSQPHLLIADPLQNAGLESQQSVTTALSRIIYQTVLQLIPKDRSFENLIQELDNSRAVQGGVLLHALVEFHITLGAFAPIDTRLTGHIQVNGWQIPLHECYAIEIRGPSERESNPAPQYLRFITQVPRNAVSRGIRATAWLDPDGSGQIQVPEEPEVYRWSFINRVPWSFPARNNLGSITQSEWRRLKGLAVMSPAGEPETGVLVEGPDGCHVLPRDQALFHPLFSYRQGAW